MIRHPVVREIREATHAIRANRAPDGSGWHIEVRCVLAETAPAVATAAGPDRLDDLPTESRPVIADSRGEGLALF